MRNLKLKISNIMKKWPAMGQAGMSYVELIVVLAIFAGISGVVMFNFGDFQARVDIKNLASDIALKIVEAQKSSLSGTLPDPTLINSSWKPSYGVYFNMASPKSFIYFVDLNNDNLFNDTACTGECLNNISITKNNSVSNLSVFYQGDPTPHGLNDLTISFSRPNSGSVIKSSQIASPPATPISYVQITILSPKGATSTIKLYPSGRVQIN